MSLCGKYPWLILAACFSLLSVYAPGAAAANCKPTEPDMLGPFYKPNAPARSSVGKGYVLQGTVRSSKDCSSLPGATIEFWLAGPDGEYDDSHRATVRSDPAGTYKFESNLPQPYGGRPPHIHIRVSAEGFHTLVTQHYPKPGNTRARFDLVLVPSR
ncbi:MAG: hypothetical protein A2010_03800 [Nitrospirae bacterium GWD2_57_9]|nr:MAG: hypothetical protein A2010_03800 [Nitrospirae bacterium GWD2_57_9]OGW51239.1 MAG: hypothetical protein A2078_00210 [Nitrospirae bacterium GWC2_57_9]